MSNLVKASYAQVLFLFFPKTEFHGRRNRFDSVLVENQEGIIICTSLNPLAQFALLDNS